MNWESNVERVAAWKKANPEKHKAQDHRRYLKHKKQILANTKEWRANNREKVREYQQTWLLGRPTYFREYSEKLKSKESNNDNT